MSSVSYKSKSLQIIILSAISIITHNQIAYSVSILGCWLPIDKPGILTILGSISIFINHPTQLNPWKFVGLVLLLLIHFVFHGFKIRQRATIKKKQNLQLNTHKDYNQQIYLIFIYLIGFSILTLAQQYFFHQISLLVFFCLLFTFSLSKINLLTKLTMLINIAISIYSILSFISSGSQPYQTDNEDYIGNKFEYYYDKITFLFQYQSWWFYFAASLVVWVARLLYLIVNYQSTPIIQQQQINNNNNIQMKDLSKNSQSYHSDVLQQYHGDTSNIQIRYHELQNNGDNQFQQNTPRMNRGQTKSSQIYLQKPNDNNDDNDNQQNKRILSQNLKDYNKKKDDLISRTNQEQNMRQNNGGQSEITNIFLLLPFTQFHHKQLQIPIYLYLFALQFNKTPQFLFYIMFVTVCFITFLTQPSPQLQLLLRICLIFVVNKNFQLAINITTIVRTIWLRSSFMLVLLVFFWFSLLTVNIFHIGFLIIILLFITKDNKNQDRQHHSFRHRNWKYLMILFDIFLASRFIYSLLQQYQVGVNGHLEDILALLGISYKYKDNTSHFNLVPLLISGVITIQYWTYTSRIYGIEAKKSLLYSSENGVEHDQPFYKLWLKKFLRVIKICYYKLIPWFSHFLVIAISIQLQFSILTGIVILWSLSLLWAHMVRPNNLQSYKLLYFRWMVLLRLLAVQITLRYVFQLLKFPFIYNYLEGVPFIQYLIQYQQILGLVIRQGSTSYFKNIFTKFQIMIALDFILIAVSFLAIQYHEILIRYEQIQSRNHNRNHHQNLQQQYHLQQPQIIQQQIQQQLKQQQIQISQKQQRQKQQQRWIQQIYQNYINFKLTQWLQSYNQIMFTLSNIIVKCYYVLLATYCCIAYNYASLMYFVCVIFYYLQINRWYYRTNVVEGTQSYISKMFSVWRDINHLQQQQQKQGKKSSKKNKNQQSQQQQQQWQYDQNGNYIMKYQQQQHNKNKQSPIKKLSDHLEQNNQNDNKYSDDQQHDKHQQINQHNIKQHVKAMYNKILCTNAQAYFSYIIQLHGKIRPVILLLTMFFILVTSSTKIFKTQQIRNFLDQQAIVYWRYVFYVMGTSYQSQIGILPYFILVIFTVIQIKCCSLLKKNTVFLKKLKEQDQLSAYNRGITQYSRGVTQVHHQKPKRKSSKIVQIQLQPMKSSGLPNNKIQRSQLRQLLIQENGDNDNPANQTIILEEEQLRSIYQKQQKQKDKKFIDVQISMRLGINKMLERLIVILLVFVSILEDQNPFSIIYLCLAWLLNYMGNNSVQSLSYGLSVLLILQYTLIITDMTNPVLNIHEKFPQQADQHSWFIQLFNITNVQWVQFLSFGDTLSEYFVLYLSTLILISYQIVFYIEELNWMKILQKIYRNQSKINRIQRKLYHYMIGVYQYALVYSPICITILSLGLYFIDFTATNMFLAILSILFVYKSFLYQNYTSSRQFWKSYFRILQLLIVVFMVIYCILITPMYSQYCNPILCSQQQFRTKVTKTILLLILQVGIDLISSYHFISSVEKLKVTLNSTSSYYKLAIAYVQNDRKISRQFKSISKKQNIRNKIDEVKDFLNKLKADNSLRFNIKKQSTTQNQRWLDTVLELLPSLIDSQLIMTPSQARRMIIEENKRFINWFQDRQNKKITQEELIGINQIYMNQFFDASQPPSEQNIQKSQETHLGGKIDEILQYSRKKKFKTSKKFKTLIFEHEQHFDFDEESQSNMNAIYRKSYIEDILPFDNNQILYQNAINSSRRRNSANQQLMRNQNSSLLKDDSRVESERKTLNEKLTDVGQQQKKKLLYLLIFQSVVSNWHYLTYMLMVFQFVHNMGIFTIIFPFLTFSYGMISTYQASKNIWKIAFLALILPIFIKYSLAIGLLQLDDKLVFLLIGMNPGSIMLQYILIFFIIVQCSILKMVSLYDVTAPQVQCMRMALIRNIINISNPNEEQQRKSLQFLLNKSSQVSTTGIQFVFSKKQCKSGYDYSTIMVTLQISILIYIFCFYQKMAIRQQSTFYRMIQYNQFSTGMVVMALIQLGFILLERILNVVEFNRSMYWDITLILKYGLLNMTMIMAHVMVIVFFPINSGHFNSNSYVMVFYILYSLIFLISALQIKYGVNKQSRGFMDRYTWYNGFIYTFYRAIPFLFEFKIFSDWTFTNTSLRLFDWIKFEEVLGHLYVAKCNSLFLRGKILGSKIQWWKKLLMGFPLLFAIILLLFGPLVLFSSLNPLSSLNQISGGYFQLSLRINRTNQYPLYINTHITDIKQITQQQLAADQQLEQIIKKNQIDSKSIQRIHLQLYSDQYWQISQGSYQKLIQQPQSSHYQLLMRVKFQRNLTGTTPVYNLNRYTIKEDQVQEFKQTLQANGSFLITDFFPQFIRLDNNNGIHYLYDEENGEDNSKLPLKFHAEEGQRSNKKYWVIDDGLTFKITSDKYSKAIFGYSVMSFYISIILVVANYFRFLFQGSAYSIILSDIPYPDSILSICDGVFQARTRDDIYEQQILFWTIIDIMRSPDTIQALTGYYLDARLETLEKKQG